MAILPPSIKVTWSVMTDPELESGLFVFRGTRMPDSAPGARHHT